MFGAFHKRFLAVLCLLAAGSVASAEEVYQLDIPAQPVTQALQRFAEQSGLQIVYYSKVATGRNAKPVVGKLSAREALTRLLAETGLTFQTVDAETVAIKTSGDAATASHFDEISQESMRLAQAEPASIQREPQPSGVISEVAVVGSRLTRPGDGPVPVTVFDRAKIETLGATSVGDVLKYLPQQSFNAKPNDGAGVQRVQLRGLGVGTTLILINGRRAVPGAVGANFGGGAFDLNTVPLASVERVEILADSGSAVYGADAVGGVVNIVLKSDVNQPALDLYYGNADGDADERRASLSIGGNTERARGLVILDYFKRDPLFGTDRELSANQDFRRFPGGVDRRSASTNPGNICAMSGNLPELSTPCAAVPVGSSGVGLTPASFAATAGQQNLGSASSSTNMVSPAENHGAFASGSYDLTADISTFGEFSYNERDNRIVGAYNLVQNVTVPASNAFNPFGTAVRANYQLLGPKPVDTFHETLYREVAGLKGGMREWDWEAAFVAAQSDADVSSRNRIDTAKLNAALAASSADQALNVFKDGPGGSDALLQSLLTPDQVSQQLSSNVYQLGGFVRGAPLTLPAGAVQFVVGGEWRNEDISNITTPVSVNSFADASRSAYAGYFETRIPLIGERSFVPGLRDIGLTVAGRYDHYSDFGGTYNGQYGAVWRPIRGLLMRGSYGQNYRAPDLYALHRPTSSTTTTVSDPRRNNEPVSITSLSGGNPNLGPETSQSWNLGGVWTPEIAGNFRVGVSFWRIRQADRLVGGVTPTVFLANEPYLPSGVIVRAAQTPADISAGLPGQVLSINATSVNLGKLDTRGVDLDVSASFSTPLGRFSPAIAATRVNRYTSQDFITSPVVQRVGIGNTSGSVPGWKVVGGVDWQRGGFELSTTARYISDYDDVTSTNVLDGLTIESQVLVDLQMAVSFDRLVHDPHALAQGLKVRVGVTNLFGQGPRYSQLSSLGFDASQADIRQRFVYVNLSKTF